jgi:hypothetical protein
MKRLNARIMKSILLMAGSALALQGCALLGSDDDPVQKNTAIKLEVPPTPWREVHISSADRVWQSTETGNTIAINSMCQRYSDLSLKKLQENILAGVENLKIRTEAKTMFKGREAERVVVDGTTDGIPIVVDLLILKKNGCTYDLAYIARDKTFDQERKIFEKFLTGFNAP